jgi:hypothetical protein
MFGVYNKFKRMLAGINKKTSDTFSVSIYYPYDSPTRVHSDTTGDKKGCIATMIHRCHVATTGDR